MSQYIVARTTVGLAMLATACAPAQAVPSTSPGRAHLVDQRPTLSARPLGSIRTPADQALRKRSAGLVTVRLRLAEGARLGTLRLNGQDVADTVTMRGRTATARLPLSGPLKTGSNGLLARFVRRGEQSYDSSRFTLTRRGKGIVAASAGVRRASGPVRVRVRIKPGAALSAWLNGRPIESRFQVHRDGTRRAQLGPGAGLRYGRNIVKVRGRSTGGRVETDAISVWVRGRAPLADAGSDRRTDIRTPIRLDGRKSLPAAGGRTVAYRWRQVSGPSRASLRAVRTARPSFAATTPGTYVLSNTARSAGADSTDRVTVSVSPSASVQPVTSVQAAPSSQSGPGIAVGSQFYPSPVDGPGVQLLVLERSTLALSDNLAYPVGQMSSLAKYLADASTQGNASDFLFIIVALPGGQFTSDTADLGAFVDAVQFLGFTVSDPSDPLASVDPSAPFQLVGIPNPYTEGTAWSMPAALDGVFTPDVNNNWTFNTGDYAAFDTAGPVTVGSQSWPLASGDGFQVVVADSISLAGSSTFFAMPTQVQQMGQALQTAASAGQVVAIRSVGTLPDLSEAGSQATADGFSQVTGALQTMGASPTVFMGLGPGDTYSFVGPTLPYSFPAEASTTIAGDGTVTGQLFRVPQGGGYAPMAADPTGTADFASGLSSIAVQPAVAWPKTASAGQQASLAYLSQKLAGGIGCDVSPCDVRTAYDDLVYQTQWTAMVSQLATYPCSSPSGCTKLKATRSQFAGVRKQLAAEFAMVDDVWGLLGTGSGIQDVYSEAQGATVGGLGTALNAVDTAVAPADNPAATTILSLVTDLMWAASIVDGFDDIAAAAGILAVAAASGNDLANLPSGNPYQAVADAGSVFTGDILDQLTTTMEGVGLLGQFIVQDWGRLSAATKIDKAWTITPATSAALSSALVNGAVQNMYSALMPVAYQAWALTPAPGTGQNAGNCQPSINPRLPWRDAAPQASYLDQLAPPVTGVEPDAGLAWYAWWEAGKSPARLFPPYGSPPPGSLLGNLYQPFSYDHPQFAGLYAPWFWGRTYLGAPAPTPGVLKCKYR